MRCARLPKSSSLGPLGNGKFSASLPLGLVCFDFFCYFPGGISLRKRALCSNQSNVVSIFDSFCIVFILVHLIPLTLELERLLPNGERYLSRCNFFLVFCEDIYLTLPNTASLDPCSVMSTQYPEDTGVGIRISTVKATYR